MPDQNVARQHQTGFYHHEIFQCGGISRAQLVEKQFWLSDLHGILPRAFTAPKSAHQVSTWCSMPKHTFPAWICENGGGVSMLAAAFCKPACM